MDSDFREIDVDDTANTHIKSKKNIDLIIEVHFGDSVHDLNISEN